MTPHFCTIFIELVIQTLFVDENCYLCARGGKCDWHTNIVALHMFETTNYVSTIAVQRLQDDLFAR